MLLVPDPTQPSLTSLQLTVMLCALSLKISVLPVPEFQIILFSTVVAEPLPQKMPFPFEPGQSFPASVQLETRSCVPLPETWTAPPSSLLVLSLMRQFRRSQLPPVTLTLSLVGKQCVFSGQLIHTHCGHRIGETDC